jgi:hypothetical protein
MRRIERSFKRIKRRRKFKMFMVNMGMLKIQIKTGQMYTLKMQDSRYPHQNQEEMVRKYLNKIIKNPWPIEMTITYTKVHLEKMQD